MHNFGNTKFHTKEIYVCVGFRDKSRACTAFIVAFILALLICTSHTLTNPQPAPRTDTAYLKRSHQRVGHL